MIQVAIERVRVDATVTGIKIRFFCENSESELSLLRVNKVNQLSNQLLMIFAEVIVDWQPVPRSLRGKIMQYRTSSCTQIL